MMWLPIVATLAFAFARLGFGQDSAHQTIQLSSAKKEGFFGESLEIKVTLKNESSKPWTLPDPEASTNHIVQAKLKGTDSLHSFSLGGISTTTIKLPDGTIQEARIFPSKPLIVISPNESKSFDFDLMQYIYKYSNGIEVWVEFKDPQIASNKLSLQLIFDERSVERLIEIVEKVPEPLPIIGTITPELQRENWRWQMAVAYLQKMDKNFTIPQIMPEDDASVRDQKKATILEALNKFKKYWKDKVEAKQAMGIIEELVKSEKP